MIIESHRWIAFLSIILVLYVLIIPALIMERSSKKELDSLKLKRSELVVLGSEYRTLKEQVDAIEQKTAVKQASGIANALDSITSSMGIKGKVKSIKGIGNREMKGAMNEESAEVHLEKINLNELVNIFYKIGDAPMILSIKRAQVKKSFENPELFDVTMAVALFTKK